MKTKTCSQCGESFPVVERGDDPTELETGTVYVGENAEICLECHRSADNREKRASELPCAASE